MTFTEVQAELQTTRCIATHALVNMTVSSCSPPGRKPVWAGLALQLVPPTRVLRVHLESAAVPH